MCLTRAGLAIAATRDGTERSFALTGATTPPLHIAHCDTPRPRRWSAPCRRMQHSGSKC